MRLQALTIILAYLALIFACDARDLGQWGNNDPEISQWYGYLLRPNPGFQSQSCCGESDAYWCDDVGSEVVNGELQNFCRITDDRPDGPRRRPHRDIGEKFIIPDDKMKFNPTDPQPNLGNPTGHAIVFLSTSGYVYCFVMAGGV